MKLVKSVLAFMQSPLLTKILDKQMLIIWLIINSSPIAYFTFINILARCSLDSAVYSEGEILYNYPNVNSTTCIDRINLLCRTS